MSEPLTFLQFLAEQGYTDIRPVRGMRWAGVKQFAFTHAIIVGQFGDCTGYDDRWCYHTAAEARAALDAWDGHGEPSGWHRHPGSGRRRTPEGARI